MTLRSASICMLLCFAITWGSAHAESPSKPAPAPAGWTLPQDPRAQKSYAEALDFRAHHRDSFALDAFKKADKQDGNRCPACAFQVIGLATSLGDYKLADAASLELIALASTPDQVAAAHVERATMLIARAKAKKQPECFAQGQAEAEGALAAKPGDGSAMFLKGVCLAQQGKDQEAQQVFSALLPKLSPHSIDQQRVSRYAERPELVRARLAPAFSVEAMDGSKVSMDELRDKVVLIDFWATWCGPCREALPHMRRIAKQFEGQPLVVLSVSLDNDAEKWKDFVGKNGMTWLQYRDGGFDGPLSRTFGVTAIPSTFTIDSDGVLQDEHVGDTNIEGKLKKLIAEAQRKKDAAAAESHVAALVAPR